MNPVTIPAERPHRCAVLVIAWLMVINSSAASGADTAPLIEVILNVGVEGRGHREAAAAWRKLADADGSVLPAVLGALDKANPLAANWLRSAAETIVDRQLSRRRQLPAAKLEAFLLDTKHEPRARRLAFEILTRIDRTAGDRLLPGMLDDPSSELRRDAVKQLVSEAPRLESAGESDRARAVFLRALDNVRDRDQAEAIVAGLERLGHPVNLAQHLGFIQHWLLIGPFDNSAHKGFQTAYPPEEQIDLGSCYAGKIGTVKWRHLVTDDIYGVVDLNKAIGAFGGVIGYAATEFFCDDVRTVELRLGSSNAWKVWVNGELVADRDKYHRDMEPAQDEMKTFMRPEIDRYRIKARLKAGKNSILLKICQNEQTEDWAQLWQFQIRVCDASGAAVHSRAEPKTAEPADPIFDVAALTSTPLNSRVLKSTERDGIVTEEVRFHSEQDGDTSVDIFAFLSYPKGARHLPAFIWNPGGLGQASPAFTEPGARRGYAVLCIDFPQIGYRSTGNYPINSGLELGDDPRKAPIYHGAVALLKAVSYLETRAEVDKNRIGMAGSSWGGFFTTMMIGIDPRLKAGSSLYGTGNLQLGNAWWDGQSQNGRTPPAPEQRERWRTTLDPAWRLPTKKTPIAWITGTNDGFYLLSSIMKSYDMAAGPKHLTLIPNWDHALPQKMQEEHFYAWLDAHLKGTPLTQDLTPVTVRNESGRLVARWTFTGDGATADLIASYGDAGNWRGRYWHTLKAAIDGHSCRAEIPDAKLACYVSGSVVDKNGIRSSTPLVRVDSKSLGIKASIPVPDYDGCSEWGGFEEHQMAYLERHNRSGQTRWIPALSADAKEGKHSAVINRERTVLPPILSTATVPHRFRCFFKASGPVDVVVQLAGEKKQFRVRTEWTEAVLDYTPPIAVMGDIPAVITIPPGSEVLVDAITFRPILETQP
jgi:dienelactone hydrolase